MQLILLTHIILLTLSLVATAGMIGAHLLSRAIPTKLIALNAGGTLVGLGAGGILLLFKPLGFDCLLLLGYLLVFSAVQAFLYKKNLPRNLGLEA